MSYSIHTSVEELTNARLGFKSNIKLQKFCSLGAAAASAFLTYGCVAITAGATLAAAAPVIGIIGTGIIGAALLSAGYLVKAKEQKDYMESAYSINKINGFIKTKGWNDKEEFMEKTGDYLNKAQKNELSQIEKPNVFERLLNIRKKAIEPSTSSKLNI
jgi:hypothetical protein